MQAKPENTMYDVTIIGGGPAGLSAALILARARQRVVLFDAGKPRNASSHSMHGFLSRDGFNPAELRRLGRSDLQKYDGVAVRDEAVVRTGGCVDRFIVTLNDGAVLDRRALFFHAPRHPSSDLAQQLGCDLSEEGAVAVNAMCQTRVAGVYAAGDLVHPAGLPFPPAFVIVAAGQGAIAGGAIDRDLLNADLM